MSDAVLAVEVGELRAGGRDVYLSVAYLPLSHALNFVADKKESPYAVVVLV